MFNTHQEITEESVITSAATGPEIIRCKIHLIFTL
jgi:hypothetical protein